MNPSDSCHSMVACHVLPFPGSASEQPPGLEERRRLDRRIVWRAVGLAREVTTESEAIAALMDAEVQATAPRLSGDSAPIGLWPSTLSFTLQHFYGCSKTIHPHVQANRSERAPSDGLEGSTLHGTAGLFCCWRGDGAAVSRVFVRGPSAVECVWELS